MIEAEKYLLKKLRGTRLSGNTHQFVVQILTDYRNETVAELKKHHQKEIDELNSELIKSQRKDGRKRGTNYAAPSSTLRLHTGRVGCKKFDGQNNREY